MSIVKIMLNQAEGLILLKAPRKKVIKDGMFFQQPKNLHMSVQNLYRTLREQASTYKLDQLEYEEYKQKA